MAKEASKLTEVEAVGTGSYMAVDSQVEGVLGGTTAATEIASDQFSGLTILLEGLYLNNLSCMMRH